MHPANQCDFITSITEYVCEQFRVGIIDSKIQEILLFDVKDTSTQDEVLDIAC